MNPRFFLVIAAIVAVLASQLAAKHAFANELHAAFARALPAVERIMGERAEPGFKEYCPQDTYCEAFFGSLQMRFHGVGIMTIMAHPEVPQPEYMGYCAALLEAVSGMDTASTLAVVGRAFGTAAATDQRVQVVADVELAVARNSGNALECRLFQPW